MISSEFKRFEVDQRQTPVDSDIIAILEKMLKQRKDSLDQFRKAERKEAARKKVQDLARKRIAAKKNKLKVEV